MASLSEVPRVDELTMHALPEDGGLCGRKCEIAGDRQPAVAAVSPVGTYMLGNRKAMLQVAAILVATVTGQ
jgi:hypothetical protein